MLVRTSTKSATQPSLSCPLLEGVEPLPQLNPKKKVFETIQPGQRDIFPCADYEAYPFRRVGFTTLETREAAWVDPTTKSVHRLVTSLGPCTAPSFVGATLS